MTAVQQHPLALATLPIFGTDNQWQREIETDDSTAVVGGQALKSDVPPIFTAKPAGECARLCEPRRIVPPRLWSRRPCVRQRSVRMRSSCERRCELGAIMRAT